MLMWKYIKVDVRNYPKFQNHLLLFENSSLHVLNVYEVHTITSLIVVFSNDQQ